MSCKYVDIERHLRKKPPRDYEEYETSVLRWFEDRSQAMIFRANERDKANLTSAWIVTLNEFCSGNRPALKKIVKDCYDQLLFDLEEKR